MDKKEWGYPTICDAAYFAQLRKDYPEDAYMDDEGLNEHYNDGKKYSTTWDHIGDAYEEYKPLADAFLDQEKRIQELEATIKRVSELARYDNRGGRILHGNRVKFADTGETSPLYVKWDELQSIIEDK